MHIVKMFAELAAKKDGLKEDFCQIHNVHDDILPLKYFLHNWLFVGNPLGKSTGSQFIAGKDRFHITLMLLKHWSMQGTNWTVLGTFANRNLTLLQRILAILNKLYVEYITAWVKNSNYQNLMNGSYISMISMLSIIYVGNTFLAPTLE